jgi:hypothetical protein
MYIFNDVLRTYPVTMDMSLGDARQAATHRAPALLTHADEISVIAMPDGLRGPADALVAALRTWGEAESLFSETGDLTGVNDALAAGEQEYQAFLDALTAELARVPPGPGDPVAPGC